MGETMKELFILVRRELKILFFSIKQIFSYSSFFPTYHFIICLFSWSQFKNIVFNLFSNFIHDYFVFISFNF